MQRLTNHSLPTYCTGLNRIDCERTLAFDDGNRRSEPEAPWEAIYHDCYENRSSFLGTSTCRTMAGGLYTYEFVLCPLRNGGSAIEQFVAVE